MGRRAVERRLDRVVRDNRFTIAVTFPAVGAVLLVASSEGLLGPLAFDPSLLVAGTLVMRLPLVAGVAPLVDRRAAAGLLVLAAYTYAVELVAVTTGFPYGDFEYLVELGPMVGAAVPLALPLFFLPLVLDAYLLCLLLLGESARDPRLRLPATLGLVVAVDLVLDPAAVGLGLWAYDAGGTYYGVPASNYAGWLLSGTVAVVLFDRAFHRSGLLERLEECEFMLDDLVSFVLLWGAVDAYFGHWIAVGVATLLFVGLVRTERFDFDVLGWRRTTWSGRR